MNITGIGASAQPLWEEAMRANQKSVSASNGQEVSIVNVDPDDLDGDGVVTLTERSKTQKNTGAASSEPPLPKQTPGTVETSLDNVGPNTFERIRTNAGHAYLVQAANGENAGAAGLSRNA